MKLKVTLLIVCFICSLGLSENTENIFPYFQKYVLKYEINDQNNTGYAILKNGRMAFYKKWNSEGHYALEVTLIYDDYSQNEENDWFSESFIETQILWFARQVLGEKDAIKVENAFKNKTFKLDKEQEGVVSFEIPHTSYSEFAFSLMQPRGYFNSASIKVRYVLTL